jgi:hypothetical protein
MAIIAISMALLKLRASIGAQRLRQLVEHSGVQRSAMLAFIAKIRGIFIALANIAYVAKGLIVIQAVRTAA